MYVYIYIYITVFNVYIVYMGILYMQHTHIYIYIYIVYRPLPPVVWRGWFVVVYIVYVVQKQDEAHEPECRHVC